MSSLVKILLLSFFIMLFTVSCSMRQNISKNDRLTDKTISLLSKKKENVFYLMSTYATFSIVWTYSDYKIEIYKLAKGRIYKQTEYPNDGIAGYQIPTSKELNLEIFNREKCPIVLDGDGFGYRIKRGSEIVGDDLPVEIECFTKNKYQSEFLNKIVADIITYKMWDFKPVVSGN